MNVNQTSRTSLAAYAIGIFGTFLIVAVLVWAMRHYTRSAPLGQARAGERKKALAELRMAEVEALKGDYTWLDKAKGIVRLPIARAMELTVQEYQNPAAARSNLVTRADKANVAPPKAPEKPNQYE